LNEPGNWSDLLLSQVLSSRAREPGYAGSLANLLDRLSEICRADIVSVAGMKESRSVSTGGDGSGCTSEEREIKHWSGRADLNGRPPAPNVSEHWVPEAFLVEQCLVYTRGNAWNDFV